MKTGFAAVQSVIEKARERQTGGGNFLPYIIWKDDRNGKGEMYERVVRFLTDDVIPCELYEFIPCKDGKRRDFVVPKSVGIDGPDIVKESGLKIPQYNNNSKLIDPKAREVTIGLVVLREERSEMVNGRRVLTYRDKTEQVTFERDGKTVTEERPVYGLVKQSNNNFWGTVAGYWSRYGTITDRDFVITRAGNNLDTQYTIIPCDPVEELRDADQLKKAYTPPAELKKVVENLADPVRARKLLLGDDGETSEGSESTTESKSAESPSEESTVNTNTQFSSLRDELLEQG